MESIPPSPFLEMLAALEHEQWIELIRYLDGQGHITNKYIKYCEEKGLFKPYSELTEIQKESDRKFARKVIEAAMQYKGEV